MPEIKRKKVVLAVINDLTSDQRLHKVCTGLMNAGYQVELVGSLRKKSLPLKPRHYATHRIPVIFQTGKLLYIEFNLRLFFYLLFKKTDIITANDLDTLGPCFVAARLRKKTLIYDTHEYFTEMAEVACRPATKAIWEFYEKLFFPRLKYVSTVNRTIADIYTGKYGVDIEVIRNFPTAGRPKSAGTGNVILYQGVVKRGRGIPLAIDAMQYLPHCVLKIAGGGGSFFDEMITLTAGKSWKERIIFTGLIPFEEMTAHTLSAKIGLCLEEEDGLNPTLALPNKLTDYIACGVPAITSDLPEIGKITHDYGTGLLLQERTPRELARLIEVLLTDEALYNQLKINCEKAAGELVWENENKILIELYQKAVERR